VKTPTIDGRRALALPIGGSYYSTTMRTRTDSALHSASGTGIILHRISEADESVWLYNPTCTLSKSIMVDDPTGGKFKTKSCIHATYRVDTDPQDVWSVTDRSQYPAANAYLTNYMPWGWNEGPYVLPSTIIADGVDTYIPCSEVTSSDEDDCVLKAWNSFVTGIRALDASTSIAEAGETPRLFDAWQRRKGAPSNIVNGFLNYSFGWKPLVGDLTAIAKELRSFPSTLRKRLKRIGDKQVRKSFKYDLSSTVTSLSGNIGENVSDPQDWAKYSAPFSTVYKSRRIVVTIRANVKPKLGPFGQDIVNKLATLGLIPSLATLWSITRLSFVIDWFYNIGGAIENLQGSLTHNISNVDVCVTELRMRNIRFMGPDKMSYSGHQMAVVYQRVFTRKSVSVPVLPVFTIPRKPMQFVLLGLLGLTTTKQGKLILAWADNMSKLSNKQLQKFNKSLLKYPGYRALYKLAVKTPFKGFKNSK
jgi:hypothetical protein